MLPLHNTTTGSKKSDQNRTENSLHSKSLGNVLLMGRSR